jgi:Cu+-exporting ATPase
MGKTNTVGMMQTIDLPIAGMTCANCANTVERTLKRTTGVANAAVNYANERAVVEFDPSVVKPAEMIERVRKAGYDVTLAQTELPLLGMTCTNCANAIQRSLRKLPGISEANVNYASERASIAYVPGAVSIADMVTAVRKAGYDVPTAQTSATEQSASDIESAAREAEIEDRKSRMIFGLVFALPAFVISMSNDFGLLAPAITAFLEQISAWWLIVGWLHITHDHALYHSVIGYTLAALTLPVMLYTAKPYLTHGFNALRNGMANMDVLVALGSGVAFLYSVLVLFGVFNGHVYFETAAMIVALISIGKYIEARAKGRTSDAIKKLIGLMPKTARVLKKIEPDASPQLRTNVAFSLSDFNEVDMPISQLQIGDVIFVKPGERIPTDGIVVHGNSAVDESIITGESMPRDKKSGDAVIGATVNREGILIFEANKIGKDTALANIIRLVERAQGSKAPIQALADKVSAIFVPVVIGIAALTFVGWLVWGWVNGVSGIFETALINAISVLVIACPCALGLATPTAIIVGMGRGAENGILFKNSSALEKAAELSVVVLDKTGTITQGKPVVTDVFVAEMMGFKLNEGEPTQLTPSVLLSYAASAERGSEHPLAKAIVQKAEQEGVSIFAPQKFVAIPGKGLTAYVNAFQVSVGNAVLMQQQGVTIDVPLQANTAGGSGHNTANNMAVALQAQGKTIMFVSINNTLAGVIGLSDSLKDGSSEAIAMLKAQHVVPIMLTGDNARSAQFIASQVGIAPDNIIADVLPDQKAQRVTDLQQHNAKLIHQRRATSAVGMVGDGINDAPALAQADVGMAIGTGTDIAIEAADITLISGDIRKIPLAIALSKLTVRGIRQNLFWAFFYNVILIPTAIVGLFHQYGPIFAAAAMAFSSLFVVGNSLRLRNAKI